MFLPENIKILIEKLKEAGYEAYAVGGCVRDSILGLSPDDYDLTTSALPEQIKEVFSQYRIIETGIKHGTLTVLSGGSPIEVTTFRVDGIYSDNRHPDKVSFSSSIVEDLMRRDFTINAIAYSHLDGFLDPFGGMEDIKNKTIRCVGNPSDRFDEDALRILRALRFSSKFGFSIEENTANAIREKKENLKNISTERIQAELMKLLHGKNVFDILMNFSEVIFLCIPELAVEYKYPQHGKKHAYDVWEHTCHTVESIDPDDDYLRLTMLLHDIGKPATEKILANGDSSFPSHAKVGAEIAEKILHQLKFSNRMTQTVTYLISIHDREIPKDKPAIKRFLQEAGEENFRRFLKIRVADRGALSEDYRDISPQINTANRLLDEIKKNKEIIHINQLAISGAELASSLPLCGKQIGDALNLALDAVIDEKIQNTTEDIIHYLQGVIL